MGQQTANLAIVQHCEMRTTDLEAPPSRHINALALSIKIHKHVQRHFGLEISILGIHPKERAQRQKEAMPENAH